ncbi:MAG: hypothetical protein HC896_15105 [Bacteroidales bacterium]|nr:hypothetical protein [Bacteroidales bacterium]
MPAGIDIDLTLPENSITLIGKGTDDDGVITAYQWNKVSGPDANLQGLSLPDLEVSNLNAGTYTFLLTVTDDDGAIGKDTVNVSVAEAADNLAPTAPANLVPYYVSYHDITLKWYTAQDNVGVIGYEIYASTSFGDYLIGRTDSLSFTLGAGEPQYGIHVFCKGHRCRRKQIAGL